MHKYRIKIELLTNIVEIEASSETKALEIISTLLDRKGIKLKAEPCHPNSIKRVDDHYGQLSEIIIIDDDIISEYYPELLNEERSCTKCGKTSDLIEEEDMCYTCAKERGRI